MSMSFIIRVFSAAAFISMAAAAQDAQAPKSPPPPSSNLVDGITSMVDLLSSLAKFDSNGRDPAQKLGFAMPERAINEYLAYILHKTPRPGIANVSVTFLPRNEVTAVVEMDFDAVRQWNGKIVPESLRPVLNGRQTVRLNVQFDIRNASLTFVLKEAMGPNGKTIPKKVMEDVLGALGSHQPESFDINQPIPLPFGLKRLWTEKQLVGGET